MAEVGGSSVSVSVLQLGLLELEEIARACIGTLPDIGAEIGASRDAAGSEGGASSQWRGAGGGRGGSQLGFDGVAGSGELQPERERGATRHSEHAGYRVADLFQRLQAFDACLLDLNRCTSLAECVPLVKSRHKQCEELLPTIAEVLRIQRERAALLAERMRRLAERMKVIDAARAKVVDVQTRTEEQASRQATAGSSSIAGNELRRSRSYSDGRRSKRTTSRTSSPGPADKVSKTTDREELALSLRKATAAFLQLFNLEPNAPLFGSELVTALESLTALHRRDADTLTMLAGISNGGAMHHTTPGEHSVEAVLERQARRQEVESAVTQHIEQGRTACFTLLDVAKQYIVAEMTQLRGRRIHGAAVRNAEHSRQEALRAGTARRTDSSLNLADPPGVPRTGSTTENGGGYAGSYADAGYTMEELREMLSGGDGDISQTAEGSRLSVQLLEEREKQLTNLLQLERVFKEQIRIVRRAEKAQDLIRFKIYSCQNRHEEAVEFGELSDASGSDSEHEDDSGFDILSLDEIQALLVKLNAQHEQTVATASQARSRLQQEVLPFLPEARFEKRLQGGTAWAPRLSPRALAGASLPPVNKATGSPSSDGQGSGMSQAAYAPDRADARGSGDPAFWVQPPVPRADSQPPAEHQEQTQVVEATLATAVSQTPGQAQTWPESHMRSQQLSQSQLQLQQQLQASSTRSALRHPPAGTGATPLGREVVASQRIAEDHAALTRRLELAASRQKEWAQQQSLSSRSRTPSYLGYD